MSKEPAAPTLPDVLDQLPVDVLDENLWDLLTKPSGTTSRSSLRSACKQTRLLANVLTTSICLRDSHEPDASEEHPRSLDDEELEVWQEEASARSAFLERLPRLTSLELAGWRSDGALGTLLTRYGAATSGRLRRLKLSSGTPLSAMSSCAISSACPRLTELELHLRLEPYGKPSIVDDLFLPLHSLPLTHVHLSGICEMSEDATSSLGGLSHLRHLHFAIPGFPIAHLRSLGGLKNLRHCRIGIETIAPDHPCSLLDVAALFTLACLTHLELPGVTHGGAAAGVGAAASVEAATAAELAAAVAPLAGLVHLQHLAFSTGFVVDDSLFTVFKALTQLTSLQMGRVELAQPLPGHLPALKRLVTSNTLRPSQLLATLLPLLPLPALECLVTGGPVDRAGYMRIEASCGPPDGGDAVAQAGALKQVCGLLAGAPRLQTITHVALAYTHREHGVLSCSQVVGGVRPLAGQLTDITLERMPLLGTEWALLASSLPALRHLSLGFCDLSDASLAAIVGCWPNLAQVNLILCQGVSPEGWLGLAAARADPLTLSVVPWIDAPLVSQCQAMQDVTFGRQNIDFTGS